MEDAEKAWPPAPNPALPLGASQPPQAAVSPKPHLATILIMWVVTIAQVVWQLFFGLSAFSQLLGFIGFVLAVFLITRKQKAARINGGLRLGVALLGLLFHLLASR